MAQQRSHRDYGCVFIPGAWQVKPPFANALANDCAFALTGGLYLSSPVNIERAKAELVCGNLYINRGITGAIVGRQPFGGFKRSGGGAKAGGRNYCLLCPVEDFQGGSTHGSIDAIPRGESRA